MRNTTLLLGLSLSLALGLLLWQSPPTSVFASDSSFTPDRGEGCQLSQVDHLGLPELSFTAKAMLVQTEAPEVETVYFSMGCFWGTEAMLGSCPGVLHTRVGFTGGRTPDPVYEDYGDHVETVEVTYDPEILSFSDLLEHFWTHHNSRAKPVFGEFASACFTTKAEQQALALSRQEAVRKTGRETPVHTAILPLTIFYPAEDFHQKYYLQQDPDLLDQLPVRDRLSTPIATKLNALAGRAGDRRQLSESLIPLGIRPEQSEVLFHRAGWPQER